MATFHIHLLELHQPIKIDLPCADLDDLVEQSSRAKFLAGHMTEPDEDGVCRRVMVATCRIQCAIEAG